MRYIDATCHLGRYNFWRGKEPITPAGLLSVMDHYGIHEALVVASMARENHPLDGNEALLRLVADQPRLHPAWAALPPRSRELPPPAELVAEMEERGVRALYLYPGQYRFTLDEWCVDELLGPLAERRVPLFICPNGLISEKGDPSDATDWPNVVRICRTFPELPVVVAETRVKRTAWTVYQALEACPNLHLDLPAFWIHHSLEFIVREFGAHRLLFSSGLPVRDPGGALAQLNYADITEEQRNAIAGGTLRRLLSWSEKQPLPEPEVHFPPPIDELHEIARERKPMRGQRIYCSHGHLGNHNWVHVPDNSAAELVAEMDRVGVELATIFLNAGMNGDETYGNDLVAAALRDHPQRFMGFVYVNLNRSPEEMRREMARGWARGMRGVKLHAYLQGYDTYGPNVEVPCQFVHERKGFILNHYWGDEERLLYLSRKYPDACFITGHTSVEAIPVVHQVPNVHICACSLMNFGITEEFVEQAGADRLLFGSDMSWHSIPWAYGPALYARIPLAAKRLILGENLRRLRRIYGRSSGRP